MYWVKHKQQTPSLRHYEKFFHWDSSVSLVLEMFLFCCYHLCHKRFNIACKILAFSIQLKFIKSTFFKLIYFKLDTYLLLFLFHMTSGIQFLHIPFFLFTLILSTVKMLRSLIPSKKLRLDWNETMKKYIQINIGSFLVQLQVWGLKSFREKRALHRCFQKFGCIPCFINNKSADWQLTD